MYNVISCDFTYIFFWCGEFNLIITIDTDRSSIEYKLKQVLWQNWCFSSTYFVNDLDHRKKDIGFGPETNIINDDTNVHRDKNVIWSDRMELLQYRFDEHTILMKLRISWWWQTLQCFQLDPWLWGWLWNVINTS